MKSIIALCLFVAAATASKYGGYESAQVIGRADPATTAIPIVRYEQNIGDSGHNSDFEAGNGIKVQEDTQVIPGSERTVEDGNGHLITTNKEITKSGSYSYVAPSGEVVSMSYTADANGFHATGSHIPVAPAMPEELARAYAEVAARPVSVRHEEDSYATPVKSNYYSAPVVRAETSYSAPALPVRTLQYAPAKSY